MSPEKHAEILAEVDNTVREALESQGLLGHQKRLVAMLSLGLQQLAEVYFHRLRLIRPGAHVKHEWFALGERNLSLKLSAILTAGLERIPALHDIIAYARVIEGDRNDLLYGSPLADEGILRKKIDAYLEVKRIVEGHGQEP